MQVFTDNFSCCWHGSVFCARYIFVFQYKRWSQLSSYLNSTRTNTNPSLTLWWGWSSTVSQQTTPARRRTTLKTMVTITFFFSEQMSHTLARNKLKIQHISELHQLINNQSLQGSTQCGMRDSSLTSTFQSWSWCVLWRRTMTQHLRMISSGTTAYHSPVSRMVRSNSRNHWTGDRTMKQFLKPSCFAKICCFEVLGHWSKTEISRWRQGSAVAVVNTEAPALSGCNNHAQLRLNA